MVNKKILDMEPKEIRKLMIDAEVRPVDFARQLNVSESAIHQVIENKSISDRIRRHIAEKLGQDVKRIWPSTYLYKNNPTRP